MFFTENSENFLKMKLDKLSSKHGFTITFGLAQSIFKNGEKERNHISGDKTMKKMLTPW